MSFYSSQVGKKSSRYCNSSLYGTNLSSVYADGPPPLDDSTQDEDSDEMVFRDPSPSNIISQTGHEEEEREKSKQLDFQPWSNKDDNKQSASGDDFGDFSSFADFSSAFGSTNESNTNKSSWFTSNGDYNQSAGTFSSEQGLKSNDFSNSDDEFGCFSGGDDSDFDGFKGFSNVNQHKESNETNESEKSVNGVESASMSEGSSAQHGVNENTVTRSDFFSDDDDDNDEFERLQSSNPVDADGSSISSHQINSNTLQNIPNSIGSREIPSIFSDDDDDDDFGEFSSSSTSDNIALSNTSEIPTDETSHVDIKDTTSKDIDSSHTFSGNNDSNTSTFLADRESSFDVQEQMNQNKANFVSQKSDSSKSESQSCESEHSRQESEESNFSECCAKADVIKDSSYSSQSSSLNLSHEQPSRHNDDDNDFGSFSTFSDNQAINKQLENNKSNDGGFGTLEMKPSFPSKDDIDEGDFGEFSTISEKHTSEDDGIGKLELKSSLPMKDDDYGDFSSVSESNTQKNTIPSLNDQQENDNNYTSKATASLTSTQDADNFGDFATPQSDNQTNLPTKAPEKSTDDFGSFSTPKLSSEKTADNDNFGDFTEVPSTTKPENNADDFGDFGTISTSSKPDNKLNDDDESFGNFATFSKSHDPKLVKDTDNGDDDDDFGNFASISTSQSNKSKDNENLGNFATFPQSHETTDDDFGDFATISTTSKSEGSHDNNDNFQHFATFSQSQDTKPTSNDDDFGEFGEVSSSKPQDDDFSDFSSVSQSTVSKNEPSNKEFFKSSSGSSFANFTTASKTTDDFGDFSSSQTPPSNIEPTTLSTMKPSKTTIHSKENQITSSLSKPEGMFKPQKNTSISRISNTFHQSFVSVELAVQRNMIVLLLKNEVEAGNSSLWPNIKRSERDGSLRFEWVTSDHQLKMLEALSMLPVRIQTSASFKSSGPVQTPLFASGLGLLEPVKGVITPFHHGVEEINPSQDPFGAPPEVGVPDLGFGGGTGKKDNSLTVPAEVKDSMDSVSVSSSLDLDFLGVPPNGNGDSTKPESRGLYEDDLLGLGMQFSMTNDSPKVLTDQKKIFKFNTTAVSLPNADKNLSEPAKKIINDLEDLSFMVSKVLMFPLKSKE